MASLFVGAEAFMVFAFQLVKVLDNLAWVFGRGFFATMAYVGRAIMGRMGGGRYTCGALVGERYTFPLFGTRLGGGSGHKGNVYL